jgi:hypothetical protein
LFDLDLDILDTFLYCIILLFVLGLITSSFPKAINPYAHVLPHVHIVEIDIPCMVIGGAVEEAPGEAGFFREQISAIDLGIGGSLIDLIVFI